MNPLRVGVVAEGATDQVVIDRLLTAFFRQRHPDISVSFRNLQPSPDGTSGDKEGGWEMVYKWCLNNPPESRNRDFFEGGLFADDMNALQCDMILIHMDADICYAIGDKSKIPPPHRDSLPEEKGAYIRGTIFHWLWPSGRAGDQRHIAAPAVECIETWLIAALSDDMEPEANPSVLRRLVEIDFSLRGRPCPDEAKK